MGTLLIETSFLNTTQFKQ